MKAILNIDEGRAYLQNADTNKYLETALASKAPSGHSHTAQEVGALPLSGGTLTNPVTVDATSPNAFRAKREVYGARVQASYGVGGYLNEGAIGLNLVNEGESTAIAHLYITQTKGIRYQAKGMSNYYELLHTGNLSALNSSRIQVLTYSGTGNGADKSNPQSLTFSFEPKLVFLMSSKVGNNMSAILVPYSTSDFAVSGSCGYGGASTTSMRYGGIYVKRSGNTVYWYPDHGDMDLNFDQAGYTYYAVAFG